MSNFKFNDKELIPVSFEKDTSFSLDGKNVTTVKKGDTASVPSCILSGLNAEGSIELSKEAKAEVEAVAKKANPKIENKAIDPKEKTENKGK